MKIKRLLFLLFLPLLVTNCVQYKQIVNFRQAPEPLDVRSLPLPVAPDHHILPDDQLSITIHSLDQDAVSPLNLASGNVSAGASAETSNIGAGYLVNKNGYINMPVIGKLKVAGLTVEQLNDTITQKTLKYVLDPIVNIRFLNFRFTILGEVSSPGTYTIANEKITLLEALGMAGDITPYGNRENILITREIDGQMVFQNINLLTQDVFRSPYFYLQKNDMIYVEPMKAKTVTFADPASRVLSYASIFLTLITLTFTVFKN